MVRLSKLLAAVSTCAGSLVVGAVVATPSAHAAPPGFTDVTVAQPGSNPLSSMTGINPLPDGRALITEKAGALRLLRADGTVSATDVVTLSVCTDSEEGLLGAAPDPAFASNHFVYLYYTRNAGNCANSSGRFNRVSRFTMTGDTIAPNTELPLLDNMNIPAGNHNGGNLEFGSDGFLYVSVGDGGANPRGAPISAGRDLSLLNGKILRITTTGGVPADNPFVGTAGAMSCATAGITAPTSAKCTEIYAYGLRNPYRFAFDSTGNRFYINDVGENTWEEVDEGGKGLDYGWNVREGSCLEGSSTNCPPPPAGMTDPITSYNHSIGCNVITAGAFIPPGRWPTAYEGGYLFGDTGCGKVWLLRPDGTVDYANPFLQTSGGIVDMAFIGTGTASTLYYVTTGSAQLHRVDAPPPPDFVPLSPARLADTRPGADTVDGLFSGEGTLSDGSTLHLAVAGRAGIAADAAAVALNVTATNNHADGFVTVYPCDSPLPLASNVGYLARTTASSAVISKLAADGTVCLYVLSATDIVVDVDGYLPTTTRLTALTPRRVLDTRPGFATADGQQQGIGALPARSMTAVPIAGRVGVPADASAVALSVTATNGAAPGYVTAFPCGEPLPTASTVNFATGETVANLALTKLGTDGSVCFDTLTGTDLVVDVNGFVPAVSSYVALTPARLLDTRAGFSTVDGQFAAIGTPAAGSVVELPVAGRGGVPAGASTAVLNLTVTGATAPGFVTAFPCGVAPPLASNLNYVAGQTVANATLVQIGAGGMVCLLVLQPTELVVDVSGAFTG